VLAGNVGIPNQSKLVIFFDHDFPFLFEARLQ